MLPSLKIAALLGSLTLACLAGRAFIHSTPSSALTLTRPAKGFAVVELFTSEGCSSCPPADQLVARIKRESKDQPVYILAFHVDYWNRLGWKDSFSDAGYTRRQNQYATWLNLQSIYTPQIVVNGSKEFVGSDEPALRKAINGDLEETSPALLTLSDIKTGQGRVDWQYQTQNTGNNISLLVAIVQRTATTAVRAGENGGQTLSHVQIVRNITSSGLKANGSGGGSISLPKGVSPGDEELIAFLQNNDNGHIIAATSAMLP